MTKIYDLSDPTHPVFIRDFGLPGQQPGSTLDPVPTELHGPISIPKLNRVYFGYGTGRFGVVQIVDRKKLLEGPKEPTEANLRSPVIGQFDMPIDAGAHTAFPLLHMNLPEYGKQNIQQVVTNTAASTHANGEGFTPPTTQGMRDFIVAVGETTANECNEPRQLVRVIDATFENRMMGVSSCPLARSREQSAGRTLTAWRRPRREQATGTLVGKSGYERTLGNGPRDYWSPKYCFRISSRPVPQPTHRFRLSSVSEMHCDSMTAAPSISSLKTTNGPRGS